MKLLHNILKNKWHDGAAEENGNVLLSLEELLLANLKHTQHQITGKHVSWVRPYLQMSRFVKDRKFYLAT